MTLLPDLFRHHRWANLTLIDALAALPPEELERRTPGGFGNIHETLHHLVLNETRFIDVMHGGTVPPPGPKDLLPLSELRGLASAQGDVLTEFAERFVEGDRLTGTFQGNAYDFPAYIPLFQAYHHGVEHRTNITTILATYDLPVPNLDLWSYQQAKESAAR
jgi:uncharacterized damage-inducible protein DinB